MTDRWQMKQSNGAPAYRPPTEVSGSFTIEQVDPSFRDRLLAEVSTRHDVLATMSDGTQVIGWLDARDAVVLDDFARADIHVTRVIDPDGTVHDYPDTPIDAG